MDPDPKSESRRSLAMRGLEFKSRTAMSVGLQETAPRTANLSTLNCLDVKLSGRRQCCGKRLKAEPGERRERREDDGCGHGLVESERIEARALPRVVKV